MRSFTTVITFLFLFSGLAQAKVVKLKLRKSTPVYKTASFDAPVIATLKRGTVIYGTRRPRPSGFGYFHKVRVKKGVYGYIPDTAVEGFKKKGKLSKNQKKRIKKKFTEGHLKSLIKSLARGKKVAAFLAVQV